MELRFTFGEGKNQIKTSLGWLEKNHRNVVQNYMFEKAKEFENYMKTNHPWRNRTYKAERTMSAKIETSPSNYVQRMNLSYGVPYGKYLEYYMGRRFAIIEPTMRLKGPQIINDMQGMMPEFFSLTERGGRL